MSCWNICIYLLLFSLSLSCSDIEKIQSGIGDKVAVFLSYFSTFVTGYIVAFTRSWKMALVVMTMLPLIATVGAITSRVRRSSLCTSLARTIVHCTCPTDYLMSISIFQMYGYNAECLACSLPQHFSDTGARARADFTLHPSWHTSNKASHNTRVL